MLNIPVYDVRGRVISQKQFEYDENTKDATGTNILFPDRLYGFSFNGLDVEIVKKDFYMRNDGVTIETVFERKAAQYKIINNLFATKTQVVEEIENRLTDLKISAIQAKYAFEKVSSGNEAEQLFKTLALVSTANNMVVNRVINFAIGFSNSRWKTGLKNFLINLEQEWNALNKKLTSLTGAAPEKQDTNDRTPNNSSNNNKTNTSAQNAKNTNNFKIVAGAAAVFVLFKKLKKGKKRK